MVLDKTFVVLGLRPWNQNNPSEIEILARNIAQENRVLYVNPPLDCADLIDLSSREQLFSSPCNQCEHKAIRCVSNQLWVLDAPIILTQLMGYLPDKAFDFVNRCNNRRLAKAILWASRSLGLHPQWLINASCVFSGYYLPDMLGVDYSVYMRVEQVERDSVSLVEHSERLEMQLASRYDAVVACSELLCGCFRSINCNTFNIGHGFDLENCSIGSQREIPQGMDKIVKPIVGFVGDIYEPSFSMSLIKYVALMLPEVAVLLVDTSADAHTHKSFSLFDNIHVVRCEHHAAHYISLMDIFINPQNKEQASSSYYPQNVMRALALGKIVVSTSTRAIECLRYNTLIADGFRQFVEYVELALGYASNSELVKRLSEFASLHSWEMVCQRFYGVVDLLGQQEYKDETLKCELEGVPS